MIRCLRYGALPLVLTEEPTNASRAKQHLSSHLRISCLQACKHEQSHDGCDLILWNHIYHYNPVNKLSEILHLSLNCIVILRCSQKNIEQNWTCLNFVPNSLLFCILFLTVLLQKFSENPVSGVFFDCSQIWFTKQLIRSLIFFSKLLQIPTI